MNHVEHIIVTMSSSFKLLLHIQNHTWTQKKTLPHLEYLSFLECLALLVQLQLLKAELWHKPRPPPAAPAAPTSICLKPFNPLISLTINSNSLDLCLWLSFPLLPIIPPFPAFPPSLCRNTPLRKRGLRFQRDTRTAQWQLSVTA